jgi:flagellar L-ring protein precursor FlgH
MSFRHGVLISGFILAFAASGCGKLFGGLRPDLDDQQQQPQYTSGGQWPEHGFLSDDMAEGGDSRYNAVGHSERGPASEGAPAQSGSWVNPDQATANQRDAYRGADGAPPSYSNTPSLNAGTRHQYKNGLRATRADFVDDSQNEGSLWASDGQTNYYFTKNKIRGVGDILSVKVEPSFIRDIGAEIQRTLSPNEKDVELQAAQDRLNGPAQSAGAQAAANGAAAPGAGAPSQPTSPNGPAPASVSAPVVAATDKDIDVSKAIEVKDGDPIMAEIVERYPNGNYKIRGTKKVLYKNGTPRLITLTGVAKGSDIGEDDSIGSGKLYEYRLEAFR